MTPAAGSLNTSAANVWKTRVASSFDRAAAMYERRANLQRRVADRLSEWILARTRLNGSGLADDFGSVKDALEIGCGTGFLTRSLVRGLPNTNWTITDLAPQMLERCRESLNRPYDLRDEQNQIDREYSGSPPPEQSGSPPPLAEARPSQGEGGGNPVQQPPANEHHPPANEHYPPANEHYPPFGKVGRGSGQGEQNNQTRMQHPLAAMAGNTTTTPGSERHFKVLDGEAPDGLEDNFDLVCSSLTFQWFTDLETSIQRLMRRVRPGGLLCFTTLGSHTFSNVAHQFPDWDFPDRFTAWPKPSQITEMIVGNDQWKSETHSEVFCERFDDLRCFLHSLKAIGAATAWQPGSSPSRLRNAIRESRASNQPVEADYQVLFVAIRKQKRTIHD